jgi:hypothetical protein
LDQDKIELFQNSKIESTNINQIEINQKITHRNSTESTKLILQEKIPEKDKFKRNKTISHIAKNRRKIIQQTITSAQHSPILDSAKTGNSIK